MSNIPSNEQIRTALDNAYAYAKTVQGGKNASYIPALAQVPSDLLAIAVVTINGDLLTAGSADAPFAIESISKAFNLAYVMDLIGMKQLRAKIGADPTGEPFNSVMAIELHGGKPLNPLVNAGAMATVSLVNGSDSDEIWGNMIHNFNNFANTALTVNQEIYKSESATNQHNRGIAWLLDSYGYFYNTPPMIVDLYTRMCSLNITASQLALMGACYANGGVNPVSKKRVVKEENVPPILAEMCMSGLYDSTGDWMYKAGLPAKSGVGGGLVAVAPGKLAMAAFSPPLDAAGNTVKGQAALQSIIREQKVNPRSQNPKGFPRVYCILSSPPRQTAVSRLWISAIKNSLPEQYAEKRIYPADNGRIACAPAAADNLSPAPHISSCLKSCTAAWLRRLP